MITPSDSGNIVYSLVKPLGLPIYRGWNDLNEDRIVIVEHKQEKEKKWMKNFVDVNLVVPDMGNEAQKAKLDSYQHTLQDMFYGETFVEHNGTGCLVEFSSIGIEEDKLLKSHFVNVKLLISALR